MKLTKSDAGTYIQLSEVYSSTSTLSPVSLQTLFLPFSVILEGPEGCQEALRKSVCSETALSLSTQELGPPGLVPVSSEYIS